MPKMSVYEIVTDRVLTALEKGVVPWRQTWNSRDGRHANLKTKKFHRGVNQLLLDISAMANGFTRPYWLSYKQAASMGGQVRKGEKGTVIVFWKMLDNKTDPTGKKIPLLRYYTVFNVAQIDGIEDKIPTPTEDAEFNPISECENIVAAYENPPKISTGAGEAWYSLALDTVGMPFPEDFVGNSEYYATLFHELIHSTRHSSRLDRNGFKDGAKGNRFGSHDYSEEELVAEMGAAFLCAIAGIDNDKVFDNSVAYLDHWKKHLTADPKLIVKAAGAAQKAVDHILGTKWDNTDSESANDSDSEADSDA